MKPSILFVDDDENILSGIRRMMYSVNKEWDLFYSISATNAIGVLENIPIDVIVSDIRMPGIDGTQLLKEVKLRFPHIIRMTLSGYANESLALKNSTLVHQSLLKPTDTKTIRCAIENSINLRNRLNDKELLKIINGIDTLPSLPEIYVALENEINSTDTSIDKIAQVIHNDPTITAKILQLTNSAFFGLPTRITSIKQALSILGIKIIKTLVLSIHIFRSMERDSSNTKLFKMTWKHCNQVAITAQKIAKAKNLSEIEIEDSYLGGLLHDIGKLILLSNFSLIEIDDRFAKKSIHANIGAYLLGVWGIPDSIVEAVAYHHSFELLSTEKLKPANIVYAANNIAKTNSIHPNQITKENVDNILSEHNRVMAGL